MDTPWTNEKVENLKQLWTAGRSAKEIAEILGDGISRCAVLGKRMRLNLPERPSPKSFTEAKQKRGHTPVPPKPKPAAIKKLALTPPEKLVALSALGRRDCRFPFGDPRDETFGFCGAACRSGSVFCEVHHALCFRVVDMNEGKYVDFN